MKRTIIFALSVVIASCSMQEPDSLEEKKNLLSEKEEKLASIEAEISELKAEIAKLDTSKSNKKDATRVEAMAIKPRQFNHYVDLTGTVTSEQNIMISAEAGGRVVSIPTSEGENVSKGTLLVRIENEAVANQLAEARTAFELAETTYRKRKNLWDQNIGSEIEYLQAKSNFESTRSRLAQTQSRYDNTVIKSPINGAVDDIRVNEGEFVSIGMPIVRVVDLQNVEIEAELSEEYLTSVEKGDSVKIRIPSLKIEMMAPISFVGQVINPDNRSFKIKVNLDNSEGRIKPNVLANMKIRDYKSEGALAVPSKVIAKDLKGDFVYAVSQENDRTVATKKYIEKGRSSGATTEILDGLKPGDKIIVAGYNQVNNGEIISVQ